MFVALLFGCWLSLIISGRLTLRLIAGGAVSLSFLPILEMASLAAVWWSQRRTISLPRAIDLFFTGHGPWSLWLIAFAAIAASVSPIQTLAWTYAPLLWLWHGSIMRLSPGPATSTFVSFTAFSK